MVLVGFYCYTEFDLYHHFIFISTPKHNRPSSYHPRTHTFHNFHIFNFFCSSFFLQPELFCCPESLINTANLPLGELQEGRGVVDDVLLPPWAQSDAFEFVRLHREALESDYVSSVRYIVDYSLLILFLFCNSSLPTFSYSYFIIISFTHFFIYDKIATKLFSSNAISFSFASYYESLVRYLC